MNIITEDSLAPPGRTTRLVVAPHADDEALGCGGLLAKYGPECAVVVLAQPDRARHAELLRARSVLGYGRLYLLDLEDGRLGAEMHHLVRELDEVLAHCRPEELYLPYPSAHQDHIATYEAGIRSARLSMTEGHWFPPTVLVYDVPAYDLSLYPTDLRWNVFESLELHHVELKCRAVASYTSQQVRGPHPANDLQHQAASVGAARRVSWAERYALVRTVRTASVPQALPQPAPAAIGEAVAAPVLASAGLNGHSREVRT